MDSQCNVASGDGRDWGGSEGLAERRGAKYRRTWQEHGGGKEERMTKIFAGKIKCFPDEANLRKTPVSPPLVALLANANALLRTGPTVFLLRAGDVPRMLSARTRDAEGATRRAGAGSGTTYAWSSRGRGLGNAYV
ncbi:hypothetical protein C8J57DRAFT_1459643 [Mycena rebaudengoi]|nr:hypothetical protein C8J57DRAFT_1459643 [Mycena rebaudengoi]